MHVYSTHDLRILGRALCTATGMTPSRLSKIVTGGTNHKLFQTLFRDRDCLARSAEDASRYFNQNWPDWVPWPLGVERRS